MELILTWKEPVQLPKLRRMKLLRASILIGSSVVFRSPWTTVPLVPEHDGDFLDWYLGVRNGKFWGITSFSFNELIRVLEEASEVGGTKMADIAVAMEEGIGTLVPVSTHHR